MLRMNEESEKGCFEPGEIKENAKENEMEEENVEEGFLFVTHLFPRTGTDIPI